ncbi:Methyltransferase type 11 [Cordyceps fumosorosea ARSEF 2679]|uniref:Methyltransferase type 11 n=1 Tax=Cordyceps fumosorosea (strain ARSEF 2679) TaxID=1081104 RepID=A0A168DCD0_CORFA|nr:Methyltransferase type 11 [Cordyceps fumosorosea ARSEF 2679]OAA72431.1 Methyltransferase type 11 [Cordyceps fumosorosea ARSEF 2679]
MPDIPSPKKRPRTSHNDETAPPDPDKTPPSSKTSWSRSSSPSKRFQKIGSLVALTVPVHFTQTQILGTALPADAQGLLKTLSAVRGKARLLPAVLRSHPDFHDDDDILDFMWSDDFEGQDTIQEYKAAQRNHEELRPRNERYALPMIEPAMSAQIMPAFRPLLASGQQILLPSSSSISSATGGSRESAHGGEAAPAPRPAAAIGLSVHKMVDYVVALRPSDKLRVLIDAFLLGEPQERDSINQTRYTPLQKRPAPIFIETKTTSGVRDSASVQLGVWLAAWYERLRNITALAGSPQEKLLTLH